MQLSEKALQKLRDWLQTRTWPLRSSCDMARWQAFVEQVVEDDEQEFDAAAVKQLIFEELGPRTPLCGRHRDEIDMRLRLATAMADFSMRARKLRAIRVDLCISN